MPPTPSSQDFDADGLDSERFSSPLIVGIGASAGGLEAFKAFFAEMPPDSGMAFVLIQHLAPDHLSMLTELLGQVTSMPVVEAENQMEVVPDHVYVIPPNATLTLQDGLLIVSKPAPPREYRRPIDTFLFSLAEEQGENAVCIILSGTGSDGALGLTAVKEHGGITFAQAELGHSAKSGMPSSAAATGQVDHVMPVEEMPARLMEYKRHLRKVQPKKDESGTRRDTVEFLPEIFALLRTGLGHDFSHYKEKTLLRRVQRRMQVLQVDQVSDFIEVLKKEPKELMLLFQDFLISVTEFFRDAESFQALEEKVIPRILESKGADSHVRVWVVACATGEEAYSLAILLTEAIQKLPASPKLVIFATDIDSQAVSFARNGKYLKSHMKGVSPERIKRWFNQEGDYYTISPQIREMCIFSVHSVLKDPPFSKLDLLSCRNLLIYLDTALQERLIPIFHYALRPSGFLFLGSSEGVGRRSDLFTAMDEKHRLFERQNDVQSNLPFYPLFPVGAAIASKRDPADKSGRRENSFERGARRVMERYAPAHVVIDRQHQILSFSGQTGKYLDPSPGAASLNFFHLIQKALRPTARILLQEAFSTHQRVFKENIPFEANGISDIVTLIVEPIISTTGEAIHYVVIFQQADDTSRETAEGGVELEDTRTEGKQLENELRATKARLQAVLDEMDEANEDLKASNEELQSMNEELHSSNEELETSKEEMQSINEELQTVNVELSNKNHMLVQVNSDLQNFLENTQIATLFLDENLCVRNFTASVTELFHLRESDKGRPVVEIASRLNYDDLEADAQKTMKDLTVLEREVYRPETDATFVMHIRPYRTVTKVVTGVVITFMDVTDRKRHELALSQIAAIVESSQDAILGHSLDGEITSWNGGAEQIFGYPATEAIGQSLLMLFSESQNQEISALLDKVRHGERVKPFQTQCIRRNSQPVHVSLTISPVLDGDSTIVAASSVARDMTEWVRSEEQRTLLLAELDHRVKNTLATVQSIARQTLRGADSLEAFYETFEARLMAVSRTHNLLTKSNWQKAPLEQIVLGELSPYGDSHFSIKGEPVLLNARQALAFGMAIHELATNAAKYGALSDPNGLVKISWTVEETPAPEKMLQIHWVETGGPAVVKPQRIGFGSQLIERSFANEKQGEVRIDFDPEGVRCAMQFLLMDESK